MIRPSRRSLIDLGPYLVLAVVLIQNIRLGFFGAEMGLLLIPLIVAPTILALFRRLEVDESGVTDKVFRFTLRRMLFQQMTAYRLIGQFWSIGIQSHFYSTSRFDEADIHRMMLHHAGRLMELKKIKNTTQPPAAEFPNMRLLDAADLLQVAIIIAIFPLMMLSVSICRHRPDLWKPILLVPFILMMLWPFLYRLRLLFCRASITDEGVGFRGPRTNVLIRWNEIEAVVIEWRSGGRTVVVLGRDQAICLPRAPLNNPVHRRKLFVSLPDGVLVAFAKSTRPPRKRIRLIRLRRKRALAAATA